MKWVVRVVTFGENVSRRVGCPMNAIDIACARTPLLECLRYAGLIVVHRQDEEGTCFDILPPAGISADGSKVWAQQVSDNMQSHGTNAVPAPEMR